MVRAFNAELTLPTHTLSGPLFGTMTSIEAGHALSAVGPGSTVGRQSATACVIGLVACLACTVDALTGPRLITIIIANTSHAHRPIGPVLANGRRATAPSVVSGITHLAEIADALVTITIPIADAGHTIAAISQTDGHIPTAARVIIRPIARQTLFAHTLEAIAVAIVETPGASASIGAAYRRLTTTPTVGPWITCLALGIHTLRCQSTAVIAVATRNTGPCTVVLHTVRGLSRTAITVGIITFLAIPCDALTSVWIITVAIDLAGNTHIAIGALNAIRRIHIAPFIGAQYTAFAFTYGAERLVGILTIPIPITIATEITIGAFHTDGRISIAADIGETLTGPTYPFGTNPLLRVRTVRIACTLCALETSPTIATKWCISTAAYIALNEASLALAIVTLALIGVVTIGTISAANTAHPKLLFNAVGRKLKAPIVGVWIAIGALIAHAIAIEAIVTLFIARTGNTADVAIFSLKTKCRRRFAATIVSHITGNADLVHTLWCIASALFI